MNIKPCKITVDLHNTFRERMPEYVQYDRNVPLEITVLENGKPADLNGLFGRLLVSKPDGHEVYSNDVEISGNVITTILGEQVFTASGVAQVTVDILDKQNSKRALVPFGMRIRSAVITDESIKSSNDYQTITALISDVRTLDAMFHVEQEQRAKVFEQSEADREQRFEAQTTEWAQTVEQAEATRQLNEERRQSTEDTRGNAEKARENAERQRVDTEAVRQRQEQERGQGEAEEDRATRMAQWEAKAEETAQKAQEAVDSAQAFVNTNVLSKS